MKNLSHRFGVLLSCLAVLLSILACEVPPAWIGSLAPGGTWYVSTAGRDSNDCLSATTACLTVGAALTKARTGGIVQIGAGRFREIAPDLPQAGIHIHGKVITLRGTLTAGVPTTLLDGAGVRTPVVVDGGDVVILQDLIIQAGGSPSGSIGAGLKISGAAGTPAGVSLRNVIIRNNVLHGVVVSGPASVTLDGVQVTGNRSNGIVVSDSQVDVRTSTISGNGVGLFNSPGGQVTISDTSIVGNSSHPGGGVINQGEMRIERSTISGNSDLSACGGCGPGIQNQGTLTLINSTVAANLGDGITSVNQLKMAYSTVAANGGSGIVFGGGSLALGMDIVENNTAQDCAIAPGASLGGASANWYYVNLSDGSCSPSIAGLPSRPGPDPELGSLAGNGGSTQTMAITLHSHAYNPSVGGTSGPPSLDADFEAPATDQRGMPRPAPGGIPDAGAYELYLPSPLVIATPDEKETPTPDIILLITDTPAPLLTFLQNANCRTGPGTHYDILTSLEKGKSLTANARNEQGSWLQLQLPNGDPCWVADSTLDPHGPLDFLPILPAPPLPDAPVTFSDSGACNPQLKTRTIQLSWFRVADATGYRLYRGGVLLATLHANIGSYSDTVSTGKDYQYELEAINTYGASERLATTVLRCN